MFQRSLPHRVLVTSLAIGFLLTSAHASPMQDAEQPPADHSVDVAVDVLERLDRTMVSVDYAGLALEHVLVDLGRQLPVPLHADWLSLDLLGIDPDTPIEMKLDNIPLSTALAGLLLQAGTEFDRPSFEYHEGRIIITTLDATARMRMLATYNVRDLLEDTTLVQRLEDTAPLPTVHGDDDDADRETDDDIEDNFRPRTPGEALLDLIADHVDPEAWLEYGGNRGKITEHDGVLLVSAPPTLHKKLREAVAQLRRAIPSNVWLDAAVVTIPDSAYRGLVRKHREATVGLARAMIRHEDTQVIWRSRAASVAIDEKYTARSENDVTSVDLAITPTLDPESQMLRLVVDATISRGGGQASSVTTSANCPDRNSAAVLEVPSTGGDGGDLRFVVLIPRTG